MQEGSFVFPKETDKLYQSKIMLLDQEKQKYIQITSFGDLCTQLKAEIFLNSYSARLRSRDPSNPRAEYSDVKDRPYKCPWRQCRDFFRCY